MGILAFCIVAKGLQELIALGTAMCCTNTDSRELEVHAPSRHQPFCAALLWTDSNTREFTAATVLAFLSVGGYLAMFGVLLGCHRSVKAGQSELPFPKWAGRLG